MGRCKYGYLCGSSFFGCATAAVWATVPRLKVLHGVLGYHSRREISNASVRLLFRCETQIRLVLASANICLTGRIFLESEWLWIYIPLKPGMRQTRFISSSWSLERWLEAADHG